MALYRLKKAIKYIKNHGIRGFYIKYQEKKTFDNYDYHKWYVMHKPSEEELKAQREKVFSYAPLLSIAVPIYRTPEPFLREMIESVQNQTYSNWELCLADGSGSESLDSLKKVQEIIEEYAACDKRIIYKKLGENLGIAQNTNEALKIAKGEYVGLLDHDDLLAPEALFEVVAALQKENLPDIIYSDEDKVEGIKDRKHYIQPHFKPDFNLELLRANNYICHFFLVKNNILEMVDGFCSQFDGAQDYDFIFRCVEKAKEIYHIPKMLYHWRVHEDSTADNPYSKEYAFLAGQRAIEGHLNRLDILGNVSPKKDLGFYRVDYEVIEKPLVSVVVIQSQPEESVKAVVSMIEKEISYPSMEVLIVSDRREKFGEKNSDITQIIWEEGRQHHRGQMGNAAVEKAKGEYLLFLDGSLKIKGSNWFSILLGMCQNAGVSAVGGKSFCLLRKIDQAGLRLSGSGRIIKLFHGLKRGYSGYLHKANLSQWVQGVSMDCLMVSRNLFLKVDGFDRAFKEEALSLDFCMKLERQGGKVAFNPYVEVFLKRSDTKSQDVEEFKEKWKEYEQLYTYYNPNISSDSWTFENPKKEEK